MYCLECQGDLTCLLDTDDQDAVELAKMEGVPYVCDECGHEQTSLDFLYSNFKIGVVLEVEELKNALKKCKVNVGDEEKPLTVVTNAKHCAEGDMVVVACEGAIVPAGANLEEGTMVKPQSVGGVRSEAMFCDSQMLRWQGGAVGILVKLNAEDGFVVGQRPPATKPRGK